MRFNQIGAGTSDPLTGLVQGPNGSLLSISAFGNLDSVNPATGAISVIGPRGRAVWPTTLRNLMERFMQPTGAATRIGYTGIPQCPSLTNAADVSDEHAVCG
jgi:hypothetical protein